jgi:triacylglycerol esterase/lipase EstA (alpha/beta hydrolase family)
MMPHRYGQIPVVFVHGTASSVGRWAEMINVLQAYQAIRDRYDFWAFSYDTGNPILYSSMILRDALISAVKLLDPEGKDPGLAQMVVIGHSQGGLLTKMMVVNTESRFYDAAFKKPSISSRSPTRRGDRAPDDVRHGAARQAGDLHLSTPHRELPGGERGSSETFPRLVSVRRPGEGHR